MSTQNTNVSVFPNLETSVAGRAAGGREVPGVAQRPTDARKPGRMKPLCSLYRAGVSLLGS
jgi:hypothetical protein